MRQLKFFLATLIIFLMFMTLIMSVTGRASVPTFSGLLNYLSNAPEIEIPFLNFSSIVLGDWGIFNFLRDFIQIFLKCFDVILFLINSLVQVIVYIIYAFRFIFL